MKSHKEIIEGVTRDSYLVKQIRKALQIQKEEFEKLIDEEIFWYEDWIKDEPCRGLRDNLQLVLNVLNRLKKALKEDEKP